MFVDKFHIDLYGQLFYILLQVTVDPGKPALLTWQRSLRDNEREPLGFQPSVRDILQLVPFKQYFFPHPYDFQFSFLGKYWSLPWDV